MSEMFERLEGNEVHLCNYGFHKSKDCPAPPIKPNFYVSGIDTETKVITIKRIEMSEEVTKTNTPWSELLYRANLNKEVAAMIIRPKELLELLAENARYREALEKYRGES